MNIWKLEKGKGEERVHEVVKESKWKNLGIRLIAYFYNFVLSVLNVSLC